MTIKNNKNLKVIILIMIISLVVLFFLLLITRNTNGTKQSNIEKANIKYNEEVDNQKKENLSKKGEQQRMQYYCGNFFKLIDSGQYEEAYKLLYSKYKENYFPNLNNFKMYFEEYFPSDFSLSYSNIERIGDIYVLMVNVNDTVNGSYGHNFDLYVVIQENSLNDYVISFSRNSAVEEEG